jgi:hypothetical protein
VVFLVSACFAHTNRAAQGTTPVPGCPVSLLETQDELVNLVVLGVIGVAFGHGSIGVRLFHISA